MENCFRLSNEGVVEVGMPFLGAESDRFVQLSETEGVSFVDEDHHRGVPLTRDGYVVEAAPYYGHHKKQRFLVKRAAWQGALVYVADTNALDFSLARATYLGEIENAWRGLETLNGQFAHSRDRRVQLCGLKVGEVAFAADVRKRYVRLECLPDLSIRSSPAKSDEFGHLLVMRAEKRLLELPGLAWTRHTLATIGCSELWSRTLRVREAELRQLSPRRR